MITDLKQQKPDLSTLATLRGRWRQHPRYRGCVGHWLMAEGGGLRAYDWSGYGAHGTLTNMDPATDWVTGRVGFALDFDGTDDYVNIDAAPFDFGSWQAITVAAWVKNAVGTGAGTDDIISYWNFTSGAKSWLLTHHNNDQYFWEINGKGFVTGGTVSTNWTHVAGTYDGSAMRLYVNGTQVASATGLSGALPSVNASVTIGTQSDLFNKFDGLIDDVCVYNRALTNSEIASFRTDQFADFAWAMQQRQRVWVMQEEAPVGPSIGSLALTGIGR